MRIILKTRFQFSHWVKMFCFQRLSQYSNLFTFSGLKWNKLFLDFALLYSPRNDPDPEMIPIFLLVDPEIIPKELGNGDYTWDCWLLFSSLSKCCNPVISFYSYEVSNKRKLVVGLLVTVSFQSRSSVVPVDLWPIYFDAMSRSAWFLVLLYGRGWPASNKLRS